MVTIKTFILSILIFLLSHVVFSTVAMAFTPFAASLCSEKARFNCYKVKRGDSWKKLFPNEEKRDLVMRLNRMNIALSPGNKIAIPIDLISAKGMDFAPLPKTMPAPGEKLIYVSIDPKILAWGAYDSNGTLQAWGPVSGGRGWCPDMGRGCHTSQGKFAIYQKEGAACKSTKFPVGHGGAPMPYCMFFNGGFALHGSYEVPGYNASHGCVRLFIPDAKWLNQEFVGEDNVTVIVKK